MHKARGEVSSLRSRVPPGPAHFFARDPDFVIPSVRPLGQDIFFLHSVVYRSAQAVGYAPQKFLRRLAMDDLKRRTDIALFKYALIAPVLQQQVDVQSRYFREVAGKEHEVPHIGRRRLKAGTLKKWLKLYRGKGFDSLLPKQRQDKGEPRKIDQATGEAIRKYIVRYPGLSSAALFRLMIAEGEVRPGQFNEGTLRRYIGENGLRKPAMPEPRKKFEHDQVNDLWIADTMYGPLIRYGKKKHKVFLISAIDDH
jgi:putative transposase